MKKVLLSIISVSYGLVLFAGDIITEEQVPAAVRNTVSNKYAQIKKFDWEKQGEFYQAEFKLNKLEHEVLLDSMGNIVKINEDIRVSDLPAKVSQALQRSYPNYKIDDVERVTKDESVLYKLELKSGETKLEIFYNKDGEVIQLPIR